MSTVNPSVDKSIESGNFQINLTLITFLIICIIFILTAICYMKLTRNVPDDQLSEQAKSELDQSKSMLFSILFFTGIAMLLFGYMILYYPKETNTVMYLGVEPEQCMSPTCSEIGDYDNDYKM